MSHWTESKFGLGVIGRSSEFRIGLLARKSGLLSLASWIRHGSRNRLSLTVESAPAGAVQIQSIHSQGGEPAVPWLMVDLKGPARVGDCPGAAYGQQLEVEQGGILRVQLSSNPEVVIRSQAPARVTVRFGDRVETVEVPCSPGGISLRPGQTPMIAPAILTVDAPPVVREWSGAQKAFAKRARAEKISTVAVYTPRWLGVSNSTKVLFEHCYPVPESRETAPNDLTAEDIRQHAEVLIASGVKRVVFSGGDEAHHRLMLALRERDPGIRFDLVFHGNFTQLQDPYVWSIFKLWADSARAGVVSTFVTMKKGAEQVLRCAGIRSEYLVNYVPGPVQSPPVIEDGRVHVGIWFSGTAFKSAIPMLAACRLVTDVTVHSAGLGPFGEQFAAYLDVERGYSSPCTVPSEELAARMRETHVSLYVTAAECSPMLPLESLQLGVPCLVGPSSHLFEEHPYLFETLVVPFPDRPEVIARYAERAFEERARIIEAWAAYAPQYNEQSRQRVERFLREG